MKIIKITDQDLKRGSRDNEKLIITTASYILYFINVYNNVYELDSMVDSKTYGKITDLRDIELESPCGFGNTIKVVEKSTSVESSALYFDDVIYLAPKEFCKYFSSRGVIYFVKNNAGKYYITSGDGLRPIKATKEIKQNIKLV